MSGLNAPDLYGFVAPAHDLPGPDVGHTGGQLAPLEHDVLGHLGGSKICRNVRTGLLNKK